MANDDKIFPTLQKPAAPGEESKNVFTELFGKDVSQKPGTVMNSVVEQQEKKGFSFFGNKPKVEMLSIKKLSTHKSNPGSSFLQFSFLVLVVTIGVFLSRNSAQFSFFGVNAALRVDTLQSQDKELTAEVRVQKHLVATLLLDQYVSAADQYLYDVHEAASVYTSQNKKVDYTADADKVKPTVLELLTQIQDKLSEVISAEDLAAATLTADNLINELRGKKDQGINESLFQDIQDLETAKALLQDANFKTLFSGRNVSEMTDDDIRFIFNTYNLLNASPNSIINSIKTTRPKWSIVLDSLAAVVKSVDPLFNTEFSGNLRVTNMIFNTDGTVTISGTTSTPDTTNFTLISNLIDTLEESSTFKNVEDRSFTKSGQAAIYTGTFRISMEIENNPNSNE